MTTVARQNLAFLSGRQHLKAVFCTPVCEGCGVSHVIPSDPIMRLAYSWGHDLLGGYRCDRSTILLPVRLKWL